MTYICFLKKKMNLHEYQGKKILEEHGVRIQRGVVLDSVNQIDNLSKELIDQTGTSWFVVKAQIHAGGRGKGGGVKPVSYTHLRAHET